MRWIELKDKDWHGSKKISKFRLQWFWASIEKTSFAVLWLRIEFWVRKIYDIKNSTKNFQSNQYICQFFMLFCQFSRTKTIILDFFKKIKKLKTIEKNFLEGSYTTIRVKKFKHDIKSEKDGFRKFPEWPPLTIDPLLIRWPYYHCIICNHYLSPILWFSVLVKKKSDIAKIQGLIY